MFVSRPDSRLPSFSELVLSIQHTYPPAHCNVSYGYMPMPMQPYYRPHEPTRSNTATPLRDLDSVSSSPSSAIATSPLGSVRLLDLASNQAYSPFVEGGMSSENGLSSSATSSVVSSPSSAVSSVSSPMQGVITSKRKHACTVCGRCFTTSGHLARHNRTHTGERKHVCPFPSCEARFARQDNCMQHYKTHINGRGRRRNKATPPAEKTQNKAAETVWMTKA